MSRKIKALTGENFLSYVNQKRIEHACTLLTTTDLPVLQIANSCGYENNHITFRRIFKIYRRHSGRIPPSPDELILIGRRIFILIGLQDHADIAVRTIS